jgi:DNA-binding NarL/FixJ family response regulator
MKRQSFRILVVDDYEPWRGFVTSTLRKQPELQIIGEASDGREAVEKAQELLPELILLDISLPLMNGFEAAGQIRELAPNAKILFISEHRSRDMVEEALRTGALGYVVKSGAARELLPAVEAAIQGKRFVSPSLAAHGITNRADELTADHHTLKLVKRSGTPRSDMVGRHEVDFYSDDQSLLDHVTQFIGAALTAGNAAIVVATESHRNSLLVNLQAYGLDIGAIQRGRYIAVDVAEAISTFVVNNMLDARRFMEAFGNLILKALNTTEVERPRVAIFGEGTHLLCAQGNAQAAIEDEKLCNQLSKMYNVDILCGYSMRSVEDTMDDSVFQQVCAEHSAVHSL